MGPPGGFNNEYHGYQIYDNKLWMAIASDTNTDFFNNATGHINAGNQRWIDWFGSLDEGVINFACITSNTENAMYYCYNFGQPYAPATNPNEEIWPIMKYENIPSFLLERKGV